MADVSCGPRRSKSLKVDKFELPISDYKNNLVKAVKENDFLIVIGETGSGKTTQLPQYLYKASHTNSHGKLIGVTQPRRIAAISVASRVSEEMKCPLGATVGYQVRFDDCTSDKTVIKYMTDGCLLREFLDDPALTKYSILVLDEAHERSLDTDILFGLVRKLFQSSKTESRRGNQEVPKVIIMSATLNHEKFSEFFSDCPVFEIPGRCFPVQNIFLDYVGVKDLQTPSYLKRAVETVMRIHLEEPPGDVLVFLTGQEEIEHACDRLFETAENVDYTHDVHYSEVEAMLILPLYGSMTTELQRRVFDPSIPSVRKVVVATNIAATSLTIEGIRFVVDSGFVKQLSYNPRTGLDSLNVVLISRSEAIQRAGRAGRTMAGKCFRLFSKEVYETVMMEETVPEIQRTSLTHVILHLKSMGIHDVLGFQYIDPPEERMILEALRQLYFFGALDRGGNVTPLGRQMTDFPLSPGLSRTVILSTRLGCEDLVLAVAAMLSVENVFVSPGGKKDLSSATNIHKKLAEEAGGTNDFATLLCVYKQCHSSSSPPRWCREHFIHWRALKMAYNIHQQLEAILQRQINRKSHPKQDNSRESSRPNSKDMLRRALCNGYFCNVARKSSNGNSFRTMDGHGTQVFIHPSSALFGSEDQLEWIIFHDITWTSKIYVRTVCPVRYEWVKELLPRLHEVDSYSLSGWAEGNLAPCNLHGDADHRLKSVHRSDQKQTETWKETVKVSKRNTEDSITAARERFLERKKLRNQQQVT